jgi:hypothetical protein
MGGGALATGFATAELHHHSEHDRSAELVQAAVIAPIYHMIRGAVANEVGRAFMASCQLLGR